jgi:hypothetical protein
MDTVSHYLVSKKEWEDIVGVAALSYNQSVHASTGYAPFELALTRVPD